jgi:hypothetical protein
VKPLSSNHPCHSIWWKVLVSSIDLPTGSRLVQIVLCPQVRSFFLSSYQAFPQCVYRICKLRKKKHISRKRREKRSSFFF